MIFLFLGSNAWSQEQLIRVQTIGVGATKAEAVTDAQINALKLSYQTFLSSDLTVVNDQIVNDEIASLVSGTIKNFEVLSTFEGDMGLWEANIDATLTQGNLVRFAEAIGDKVKVQGALFGAEIKQQNLNKANELTSIKHLIKKAGFLIDLFDAELKLDTPKVATTLSPIEFDGYSMSDGSAIYQLRGEVILTANENFEQLYQLVYDTLAAITMTGSEQEKYGEMGKEYFSFHFCKNPNQYSTVYGRLENLNVSKGKFNEYGRPASVIKINTTSGTNFIVNSENGLETVGKKRQEICNEFLLRNLESIDLLLFGLEQQIVSNYKKFRVKKILVNNRVEYAKNGADVYPFDWAYKEPPLLNFYIYKSTLPRKGNHGIKNDYEGYNRYKAPVKLSPVIGDCLDPFPENCPRRREGAANVQFQKEISSLHFTRQIEYTSRDNYRHANLLVFPVKGDILLVWKIIDTMGSDELATIMEYQIETPSVFNKHLKESQEGMEDLAQKREEEKKKKDEKSWWEW